ncbi:hypothetical protein cyc_06321 [Cyclospora cayetanensis]|uniref:Uncharacterized protein n=1 Tax=Cyclospora cayetanensis TaxID=88456 RepID=A0A1D3D3P1_9EIME|nr:hypothetical protein cyc_06321 [Cyclospora cayetanensis]
MLKDEKWHPARADTARQHPVLTYDKGRAEGGAGEVDPYNGGGRQEDDKDTGHSKKRCVGISVFSNTAELRICLVYKSVYSATVLITSASTDARIHENSC